MNFLLDTNAILNSLKESIKPLSIQKEDSVFISFITKIELLVNPGLSDEEDNTINRIIDNYDIIYTNDNIINTAIHIRKKYSLKIPDAILVATAIDAGATLVTSDKEIIKKAPEMDVAIFDPQYK